MGLRGEHGRVGRGVISGGQRDSEGGDGVVALEDRSGDGVDVLVVLAVVGGVAAGPRARELVGQVAGIGEGARCVSL